VRTVGKTLRKIETPEERVARKLALLAATVLSNRWIPGPGDVDSKNHCKPTPEQAEFYMCEAEDVLFGGQAGPGKSEALLVAALQYVDVSGYAALLLRRTYKDLSLPGALMDRAREWLIPKGVRWNGQEKTFTFPSGSTLTFGHIEHENDKFSYQGSQFDYIGFDELTQFTKTMFTYLHSRLRHEEGSSIPSRMRAASNPGGIGEEWVYEYFVKPREDGRQVGETAYIPATLESNRENVDIEDYLKRLKKLDPVTRMQLMEGKWRVKPAGKMFARKKFRRIACQDAPAIHDLDAVARIWDLAATEPSEGNVDPDWTRGQLWGMKDGLMYLYEQESIRARPYGVETLIHETAKRDGQEVPIVIEQEPGSSGKSVIENYQRGLPSWAVYGDRPTGSKVTRARPFSASVDAGMVYIVDDGSWDVDDYLDEVCVFPSEGYHDDQVDPGSAALSWLPWFFDVYESERRIIENERPDIEDERL